MLSFIFFRYFETMLTMFDERRKSEVELKDIVEPTTLALSLHFIYEGDLQPVRKRILSKKNVHDLLQLAIYLQIQSLQTLCCKYIQERLDKKNCIGLYQHALDMGPFELQVGIFIIKLIITFATFVTPRPGDFGGLHSSAF